MELLAGFKGTPTLADGARTMWEQKEAPPPSSYYRVLLLLYYNAAGWVYQVRRPMVGQNKLAHVPCGSGEGRRLG